MGDLLTRKSNNSPPSMVTAHFTQTFTPRRFIEAAATNRIYKGKYHREPKGILMLYWLGIVVGLLFIIMCFSKGLKDGNKPNKSPNPEISANNKKKDLSDEDVHLLARILSVGLVDADPNYLHHLKGYRDLHGG